MFLRACLHVLPDFAAFCQNVFCIFMLKFITAGILCGLFSGCISRFVLKKAIQLDNKNFLIIWCGLFFFRLLFLILSVFFLHVYGLAPLLCFSFAFIIVQEIFLLVPLYTYKEFIHSPAVKMADKSSLPCAVSVKNTGTKSAQKSII